MLIKFKARDMRTNLEYEFVTPVDQSQDNWERNAWRDIVKTWTLPTAVQPLEWKPYAKRNDRLRDKVQQNLVVEETDNHRICASR